MELENEREIEWNFFDSILFFSFPCRAAGHVRNGRTFFLFFLCLFVLFFLFFCVCVCVLFDIVSFFCSGLGGRLFIDSMVGLAEFGREIRHWCGLG